MGGIRLKKVTILTSLATIDTEVFKIWCNTHMTSTLRGWGDKANEMLSDIGVGG